MDGGGTKRCKKTDKRSPKGRAADLERESGKRKRRITAMITATATAAPAQRLPSRRPAPSPPQTAAMITAMATVMAMITGASVPPAV